MNATFLLRFKAFMIDYLFIFAYLITLVIISVFLFPSLQTLFNDSIVVAQITSFILVTLPVSLYFIITDSVLVGQSFGKKKIGIHVVNNHSNPPSIQQSILRTIIKFLPWELSHYLIYRIVDIGEGEMPLYLYGIGGLIYVLMIVYILTAIFTKKRQSLYDMIVNTQVIELI